MQWFKQDIYSLLIAVIARKSDGGRMDQFSGKKGQVWKHSVIRTQGSIPLHPEKSRVSECERECERELIVPASELLVYVCVYTLRRPSSWVIRRAVVAVRLIMVVIFLKQG